MIVGEVLGPHGIRGEVRVYPVTDFPERFLYRERFYVGRDGAWHWFDVQNARFHKGVAILKLEGVETRNLAEGLRSRLVCVPESDLPPLEEGHYYHHQIVGLVVKTVEGQVLGRVEGIHSTGANDVYLVKGEGREYLVPALRRVVRVVDLESRTLTIEPLPGMLE